MVRVPDVKKRMCVSLSIGFTIVTGIREGHGGRFVSQVLLVLSMTECSGESTS